jgi:hypothetical protein
VQDTLKPTPGSRVQYTIKFLQNVQIFGPTAQKRYTVIGCDCGLCGLGRHVAVDEIRWDGVGMTHIASVHLELR